MCKTCDGKGWLLWVYPARKARGVFWFNRGPHGERPSPCTDCNTDE